MQKLILFLLAAGLAIGQTSSYPAALDNDASLFVTADFVQSTLSTSIGTGDSTLTVADPSRFAVNQVITICDSAVASGVIAGKCLLWEHMKVTAVNGNVLTVTRGVAGTSARAHTSGKAVSLAPKSVEREVLADAVKKIETALGANLSNVAGFPTFYASLYDFAEQTPGGSLIIGANTISLAPCPAGVNGTDSNHYLYISAGTGTAEAAPIIGGTCTASATSGTVIVTAAKTHSGAWTIQSASGGIAEAAQACPATGCMLVLPATFTLYQTVTIGNGTSSTDSTRNGVHIYGYGPGGTPSEGGQTVGSRVTWAGPSGGVMFQWNGPVYNTGIEGAYLNCNGSAATAVKTIHATGAATRFAHLAIVGCSGFGIIEDARASGFSYGASATWEDIHIDYAALSSTASGMVIGPAAFTTLDVARSRYRDIEVICGASGTGLQIQAADSLTLTGVHTQQCSRSVYFQNATGNTAFPNNIMFYRAMLNVTPTWSGGWTGDKNISFFDYDQEKDGFGVPQPPFPSLSGIRGFTSYGAWYGNFGINTLPTLANFELLVDGASASMMAHNKTSGNSTFELLNEGVGGLLFKNTRAGNTATIESDGVDIIWSLPLSAGAAVSLARPLNVAPVNYIASETGANNAIAGALSGVTLTAGLRVTVKLAHTLQAGANTFNFNAGGAVAIKSARNPANNIGTAYAATGTITLQYDGTQWQDVSQ